MINEQELSFELDHEHRIRQALESDAPRIAVIWLEGIGTVFGKSNFEGSDGLQDLHQEFTKLIAQQDLNFKFWICEDASGHMVGWSTIMPFHTSPLLRVRNAYGFISTYMSENVCTRGLGSKLLQFAINYCKTKTHIRFVFGLQDRSNVPSVVIGDRVGFKDFGALPLEYNLPPFSIIVCHTPREYTE